jgi:folate-binding protein YgfZ
MDALCAALKSAGAVEVGDAAVEVMRIVEGVPRYGVDIAEKDLPQESSLVRALHFNKGCYLGQEIVERIRSRGNVHRHLRQLEFVGDVPAVGSDVFLKDAVAGSVTSVARVGTKVFGLAMLKAEAELPDAELKYAGGSARVLAQPPSLKEIEKEIQ